MKLVAVLKQKSPHMNQYWKYLFAHELELMQENDFIIKTVASDLLVMIQQTLGANLKWIFTFV